MRRIANLPAAIVYDWDGCSRALNIANAASGRHFVLLACLVASMYAFLLSGQD